MRTRAAVVIALAATVAVCGGANASTKKVKPVCHVVQGTAGDAPFDPTLGGLTAANQAPEDPNGDILSADIASNAKYVTAVIRVKTLATPDTTFPEAHLYMLSWSVPGHSSPVYLAATVDPNPASAAYGPQFVFGDGGTAGPSAFYVNYYNIASAAVKGTVNTKTNTITLSVPIAAIKSYGKFSPGNAFTGIQAQTQALANGPVLPTNVPAFGGSLAWGWQEDLDNAAKAYVAGTPSCVTPGA